MDSQDKFDKLQAAMTKLRLEGRYYVGLRLTLDCDVDDFVTLDGEFTLWDLEAFCAAWRDVRYIHSSSARVEQVSE
jgi:hypothetical protein